MKTLASLMGALAALCLSAATASAQTPPDDAVPESALAGLYACAETVDDTERLACFDAVAASLKQTESDGDLVAVSREEIERVERDAFGFNLPSLPRLFRSGPSSQEDAPAREAIDRLVLPLVRAERTSQGRYRFVLENGQVWVQTESERVRRPRPADDGTLTVEIRRGSFGSHLLKVNGKGTSLRVRRVE